MPSWAVMWDVDDIVHKEEAAGMARNGFALDARANPDEALEWHAIDEKHWIEKGSAPNHWSDDGR
jgi:hypothetical protein